jgi:hypothetical protein
MLNGFYAKGLWVEPEEEGTRALGFGLWDTLEKLPYLPPEWKL